ncbi:ferrochelatase [PVC group bacterium (ex Bugula neritina AB1)]|nr:ferrochelatase [PVC group bacterium (ex Bugula neritina AB1)]
MAKDIFLFVNLGSPDSPSKKDVKKYLDTFLMDPYVIDLAWIWRALLVKGIILPFRTPNTSEAYKSIWLKEGSPLVIYTQNMVNKLKKISSYPIYLGMTYGSLSIEKAIGEIMSDHGEEDVRLNVLPLFPHYAMSTTEAVIAMVKKALKRKRSSLFFNVVSPFYNDERYIEALRKSLEGFDLSSYDKVLFSYHGLPVRHLRKTDPTKKHCFKVSDCCKAESLATETCYRSHVLKTTELLREKLDLPVDQHMVTFQSRLGRDEWLTPSTEEVLKELPGKGCKKILLISPSFVADCLETLEELSIRGKEVFFEAGGTKMDVAPCLNEEDFWVEALNEILKDHCHEVTKSSQI